MTMGQNHQWSNNFTVDHCNCQWIWGWLAATDKIMGLPAPHQAAQAEAKLVSSSKDVGRINSPWYLRQGTRSEKVGRQETLLWLLMVCCLGKNCPQNMAPQEQKDIGFCLRIMPLLSEKTSWILSPKFNFILPLWVSTCGFTPDEAKGKMQCHCLQLAISQMLEILHVPEQHVPARGTKRSKMFFEISFDSASERERTSQREYGFQKNFRNTVFLLMDIFKLKWVRSLVLIRLRKHKLR